jgi:hypothetical protein
MALGVLAVNRNLHSDGGRDKPVVRNVPNSIQFNLFHPRIIIHDMGQVKQFPYIILDHYSELQ